MKRIRVNCTSQKSPKHKNKISRERESKTTRALCVGGGVCGYTNKIFVDSDRL